MILRGRRAPAGAGGRFLKKAPQKLFYCALFVICANIAVPHGMQCVRSSFIKGAIEKFFAELFFKKATSRARRRPPPPRKIKNPCFSLKALDFVEGIVYNGFGYFIAWCGKGRQMDRKQIKALIEYAVGDTDLESRDIPSIDLYLDQIINLVAEKNAESTDMYRDRVLTPTMVNNYSKDGLIKPIRGKKYSREHIIQMLLVYSLKNTLSIGAIRRILTGVYSDPVNFDGDKLAEGYDRYLDVKERNRAETEAIVEKLMADKSLSPDDDLDFFVLLLGIVSLSADLKNTAIALLEARYPDMEAVRREELEKERERIREEKAEAKKAKKQAETQRAEEKKTKKDTEKKKKEDQENEVSPQN